MTRTAGTRTRVTSWLQEQFPALAREWLPTQRWFGGKARTIEAVSVEDIVWLPLELPPGALLILDVRYTQPVSGTAHPERYAMVVGLTEEPNECPVIANVPWQPRARFVEAAMNPSIVVALLRGLTAELRIPGESGGAISYSDVSPAARQLLSDDVQPRPTIVPLGVEQSNTSVRVGPLHAFKLFRRLVPGENPQIEIGRFLQHTDFRSVPPLEGSLIYHGSRGDACALGALEGWIDNQGDGWRYLLARIEHAAHDATLSNALVQDMDALGATTADFHAALASDTDLEAFASEPVTSADVGRWLRRALDQAERTFEMIQQQAGKWRGAPGVAGRPLTETRQLALHALGTLDSQPPEPFQKIRIHGDFHLGQTLKTHSGFALIDFEGEPTKPLSERREKQCALRDVAGMVRSLEYAAATAGSRRPDGWQEAVDVAPLRDAFIESYRSRAMTRRAEFLPSTPAAFNRWLEFYELQKALYEVEYEANNRPDWMFIPLRAVERLARARPGVNGGPG